MEGVSDRVTMDLQNPQAGFTVTDGLCFYPQGVNLLKDQDLAGEMSSEFKNSGLLEWTRGVPGL